ncbi:hypothetical protein RF11_04818 [Thelohanellus kitauei]|uniref:Uncharacterized protein n=1 Tax=Thelohanellus kitauei TaxID=669202 RepID=A0A0C2JV23_THEKT|nr:hypothetical protein RF11_04818 [Thelohanellus kitauei]
MEYTNVPQNQFGPNHAGREWPQGNIRSAFLDSLIRIENYVSKWKNILKTTCPISETDYFNVIEDGSREITPSDCYGHYRNMLKYIRCYLGEEINENKFSNAKYQQNLSLKM